MSFPSTPLHPPAVVLTTTPSLRHLPVNLFASVMGLSGLALAWRQAAGQFGAPAVVGEAIGAFALAVFGVLAAAYLAKLARHPDAVVAEFRHPVAGNFFGTIAIAVLLLSAVLQPYGSTLAGVVWTLGTAATFLLSGVVVSRLLRGGIDAKLAVPAWVIPGVATLDIAVTGARMPMAWAAEVNWAAMALGTVLALVLLVMVLSRLVHHDALAGAMVPSLMVLIGPFAVGFLAYTAMTGAVDRFASMLFYFALFIFIVLAPKVFRRDVPFAPSWWAIGFPLAALGNAALHYAAAHAGWPLQALALALLAFLTVVLAVLTVRTLRIAIDGRLLAG
ncbi:SLAC1 anion channel family protein [Rhizobacter sp. SG703]|uniref:SLAC1 anion channel family protein n=1 Tax=Rhizobacter sp. SG703 TaxID=2587140 RepID=UPI0014461EB6|nr:SLAC1 anion channel family protein [Rhizobacter sp. SG703]